MTLEDEKYRVSLELTRKLSSYFTPGFMSVDRMDAGFSFVQGNAAMITSGSWDASSYIKIISDQPFGDIILSVGDAEVSNAKEAVDALMTAVKRNDKAVLLLVDREGAKRKITVKPVPGATTWESNGIKLEDVVSRGGRKVPVVTELDSASPASASGMTFKKSFDVGIVDFPMPSRNDSDYGKYVVGKVVESSDIFGLRNKGGISFYDKQKQSQECFQRALKAHICPIDTGHVFVSLLCHDSDKRKDQCPVRRKSLVLHVSLPF